MKVLGSIAKLNKYFFVICAIVLGLLLAALVSKDLYLAVYVINGPSGSITSRILSQVYLLKDLISRYDSGEASDAIISELDKDIRILRIKQVLKKRHMDMLRPVEVKKLAENVSYLKKILYNQSIEMTTNHSERNIIGDYLRTNHHHAGNKTAQFLYDTVKVLCYIPVSKDKLSKYGRLIWNTWAHNCNKLIFFAEKLPPKNSTEFSLPIVDLQIPDSGSNNLTDKMYASMQYLYEHHLKEYDWFMKADSDTYVIAENPALSIVRLQAESGNLFWAAFFYDCSKWVHEWRCWLCIFQRGSQKIRGARSRATLQ